MDCASSASLYRSWNFCLLLKFLCCVSCHGLCVMSGFFIDSYESSRQWDVHAPNVHCSNCHGTAPSCTCLNETFPRFCVSPLLHFCMHSQKFEISLRQATDSMAVLFCKRFMYLVPVQETTCLPSKCTLGQVESGSNASSQSCNPSQVGVRSNQRLCIIS